jgi:hypothetical protein
MTFSRKSAVSSTHTTLTHKLTSSRRSPDVGGCSSVGSQGASFFEADTQRPESSSPDGKPISTSYMTNSQRLARQGRIFNHSGVCGKIVL